MTTPRIEAGQIWRRPDSTYWRVLADHDPKGYVRFESRDRRDAVTIVNRDAVIDRWTLQDMELPDRGT